MHQFSPRSSLLPVGLLLILGIVVGVVAEPAQAQSVAVAPRASTLGLGADVTVSLTSTLNLRAGGSYLPVRRSGEMQDQVTIQYDVEARLAAAQLLLDWHPFRNAIRLSLGAMYNGTRFVGRAQPVESYTVQQKTFGPERLGRLDAEVSLANKVNPYLGIGFGNAVRGSALDVFVDLGAMYVAQPEVQLSGTGLISATSNHQSTLNEGLRSFHLLPYLALGVSIQL